jgi:hypothetical protein
VFMNWLKLSKISGGSVVLSSDDYDMSKKRIENRYFF